METLYLDTLNKKWSIVMARISFLTKFGLITNKSYKIIKDLASLMRSSVLNVIGNRMIGEN